MITNNCHIDLIQFKVFKEMFIDIESLEYLLNELNCLTVVAIKIIFRYQYLYEKGVYYFIIT